MITITGSLAFDHIMDFPGKFSEHIMPDKIHQLNLSFYLETLKKQNGGTAGNIAYNLSLFKIPVAVLATVGRDFMEYNEFLKTAGVNTSAVKIIPEELTASAFIMTDLSDNQISGFYPGAIKLADSLSVKGLNPLPSFLVIGPDNPKAMVKFAGECQELGIPYMLDPGMQLPSLSTGDLIHMLKGAKVLIGNDYEITLLKEKLSLSEDALKNQVEILITTLGDKGSLIQTQHETINIPPCKPNQVIDPTGAGDAYRGGFLAGKEKGFDLKTCGQMGSVTACYAIEKYGTSNHTFSVKEFCTRYEQNFGTELKL